MDPQGEAIDYNRPVAYDEHGRPLYAHPPVVQAQQPVATVPIVAHPDTAQSVPLNYSQPISIDSATKQKHDEAVRKYPMLNLSEGEYVISSFKRHPIGLISIWGIVALSILIILVLPIMFYGLDIGSTIRLSSTATIALGLVLLGMVVLAIVAGIIATYVYESNMFFLTNEAVTQRIQASLFSRKLQSISLGSVEDVSYRRSGVLQTVLNYGSIRLSTEGEETTYRFSYVSNPERQVHMINNAMEAFRKTHQQGSA